MAIAKGYRCLASSQAPSTDRGISLSNPSHLSCRISLESVSDFSGKLTVATSWLVRMSRSTTMGYELSRELAWMVSSFSHAVTQFRKKARASSLARSSSPDLRSCRPSSWAPQLGPRTWEQRSMRAWTCRSICLAHRIFPETGGMPRSLEMRAAEDDSYLRTNLDWSFSTARATVAMSCTWNSLTAIRTRVRARRGLNLAKTRNMSSASTQAVSLSRRSLASRSSMASMRRSYSSRADSSALVPPGERSRTSSDENKRRGAFSTV
mmetsp:Transcript_13712/g.32006  ORF Transcript_13712/g.32006 Transcript_13712/m.32006 type:complete len:265 (-) Transcript_13712:766-1560(-)